MKYGRINNQISINDTVRITDSGETYTNYSEKFNELGFKDKKANRSLERGETAIVFNIGYHEEQREVLYALVHEDGRECLISSRGIELVEHQTVDNITITDVLTRLSEIESKLDQLAKHIVKPAKSQTAVEWLIEELESYDYATANSHYDICISAERFDSIKKAALEMEQKQNSK